MIYKANSEILENMDKNVDVHNISEERNVGNFNYASIVRDGGKFLKSTSQDVVVKPSTDLFEIISPGEFRKFWNRSAYIQEIKTKSNEKMCLLQEKRCKERDLLKMIFVHFKKWTKTLEWLEVFERTGNWRTRFCLGRM